MLLIAPHLDDAVLACGQLLIAHPGAVVATLFAGVPQDAGMSTPWDLASGFSSAREAVAARREEDRTALGLLGARHVWLDFCDDQYRQPPSPQALSDAVRQLAREHSSGPWLIPMGLYHADHFRVHDACLQALGSLDARQTFGYEDAIYRAMPGLLQQRLMALAQAAIEATPAALPMSDRSELKANAVAAYASQVKAFGPHGLDDASQPERYWRLLPVAGR